MRRIVYVVDDVPTTIEIVKTVFKNDPNIAIENATEGKKLLESIREKGYPDLILLDLIMPGMDGFEVLKKLKDEREKNYFPIVVLSAQADKQSIVNALHLGADDYVTKPFFFEELKARVYNMLKLKDRDELLNRSLNVMETNLLEKIEMLEQSQYEIIIRLGKAAEFRDDETGAHIERIRDYAGLIAENLGLDNEQVRMIKHAAPMHDVGKIGIPDSILLKPGKLSSDEFEIIKLHTVIGGRILGGSPLPLLELASEIAMTHHERWDGNGYPLALKGKDIPISGRIIAIADVFDALTTDRVYRVAWPIEKVLDYINWEREKQFDPEVVDAFFSVADSVMQIKTSRADGPMEKPKIKKIIDGVTF
ncbi:MAG: HD domain-containing phosphohydrolase [Nitrospirota bacterium]